MLENHSLQLTFFRTKTVWFQWVEPMRDAGADQYTFHIEATDIPLELCRKIRESGMKVCQLSFSSFIEIVMV